MTLTQAYKVLGVSNEDDDRDIKKKYKRLLVLYHPDSNSGKKVTVQDEDKIRQIIEAYKIIRDAKWDPAEDKELYTWEAVENHSASSKRNVYIQIRIYDDEELPLSNMGRGRYVWDPDLEEFPLFTKSVLEACKDLMAEKNVIPDAALLKRVFHLMMQEYILPADCARKLGKLVSKEAEYEKYVFYGYIAGRDSVHSIKEGEPISLFLMEDKAIARNMVTGKDLGFLSFDEDSLYYVLLPLLEDESTEYNAQILKTGKIRRGRTVIPVRIEMRIHKNLKDRMPCFKEQINILLKK